MKYFSILFETHITYLGFLLLWISLLALIIENRISDLNFYLVVSEDCTGITLIETPSVRPSFLL